MRIVIVGAGQVGSHLGQSLQSEAELILIDSNSRVLAAAEENLDVLTLAGDATHRSVLRKAEVDRADLVVAVTDDDAVNLVIAALARELGAARTVARVDDPSFYETERGFEAGVLGIEATLCASRLVGVEFLRALAAVRARQVVPCASGLVQVASHVLGEDSPLLSRSRARATTWPAAVRAIVRTGQLRPSATVEHAEAGDILLMACGPLELLELLHELTPSAGKLRTAIVGGGDVGVQLAELLGPRGFLDRLVEVDRSRCWALAARLHDVQVLHGDGTNIAFLREEQIARADALLAVTGSDEANLMTSLLARELGVAHVFALVTRPGYAGVYSHLGVTGTASPHETIAHVLRSLLPRGVLVGRHPLSELGVDVVELRPGAGVRVGDLPLPSGAIPMIIAGRTIVPPKPRTTLEADDVLVVALPSGRVPELEKSVRRSSRGGDG